MAQETLINIGICSATFIIWVLAILSSVSMRRLGCLVTKARKLPLKHDQDLPPITIVVTSHNQEADLQRNLPMFLNQYYPNFEVIVVDIASKDGTKDLLEHMEEEHRNLRHTFTPSTSRDISRGRLAITLGMKSATNPWVLVTKAEYTPISHNWLLHMVNTLSHHRAAEIVLGYARYSNGNFVRRKIQHFNLWQQMLALPYALKNGAYRTGGDNILYNRNLFMQHQGFASSATLLAGEMDILVNRNSTRNNTAICIHPESILSHNEPSERRLWKQERIFFQETRTHFSRKYRYRMEYAYRVLIHLLNRLMLLMTITLGVYFGYNEEPLWYIASAIAFVLGLTHFIVQGACYNYTAKMVDDRKQNYILTSWYISLTPLWDISAWIRHKFTSNKQFRKKYI